VRPARRPDPAQQTSRQQSQTAAGPHGAIRAPCGRASVSGASLTVEGPRPVLHRQARTFRPARAPVRNQPQSPGPAVPHRFPRQAGFRPSPGPPCAP